MRGKKMKAIILAAGKGERLKKYTAKIPKPMLTVKREIVLEHNLRWLKKNGIDEVYINLHYFPEVIRDYFVDGSPWGIKIKYSHENEILGTAGAVRKILNEYVSLEGEGDYLVIYGDNFYPDNYQLAGLINFHLAKQGILTLDCIPHGIKMNLFAAASRLLTKII